MAGSSWVEYLQYGIYIPVLVVGLPLNIGALWQLFFCVHRWNESTVYLLNLIINDCLLLLTLPFKILAYNRPWYLGTITCTMLESFTYVNVYGSIFLSMFIAVDRYVALRFPFRQLRSPRKATLICLLIWIIIFSSFYPVTTLHSNNTNTNMSCFQNFSNSTWKQLWIVVYLETVFNTSAIIIVLCSVQVVKILQDLRKKNPNDFKLRNNKSIKVVLSNLVVFLLCFIPYHIAVLLYFYFKRTNTKGSIILNLRNFVHVSLCVSSVNCLADGACYYFILKENLQMERKDANSIKYMNSTQTNIDNHTPPLTENKKDNT